MAQLRQSSHDADQEKILEKFEVVPSSLGSGQAGGAAAASSPRKQGGTGDGGTLESAKLGELGKLGELVSLPRHAHQESSVERLGFRISGAEFSVQCLVSSV